MAFRIQRSMKPGAKNIFISSTQLSEPEFRAAILDFIFWCDDQNIEATQFGMGYDRFLGHTTVFEIQTNDNAEIPEDVLLLMTLRWS